MNRVLIEINEIKAFDYLNGVIIVGTSVKDHQKKLKEFFTRLRKFNLKLQSIKCKLLRKEVSYSGLINSKEKI